MSLNISMVHRKSGTEAPIILKYFGKLVARNDSSLVWNDL